MINKGITFVDFHSVGKTPDTIDLKKWHKENLRPDQYNTIQYNTIQYLYLTWSMHLAISYFTDMPRKINK